MFDQAVLLQLIDCQQQLAANHRLIQLIDSLFAIGLVLCWRRRQGVGAYPQVIGHCLGALQ